MTLLFAGESKIPVIKYHFAKHLQQTIVFNNLPALINYDRTVDVLWEHSLNFKQETPGWQGMMQNLNILASHQLCSCQ